jgi:hypothetical protein
VVESAPIPSSGGGLRRWGGRSSGSVGEGDDALWGKKSHGLGRMGGGSRWLPVRVEMSKIGREIGGPGCHTQFLGQN